MQRGSVKRIIHEKGFGFIAGTDGVERFFHHSQTEGFDRLREGDPVSFEEEMSKKGPRATNVSRV